MTKLLIAISFLIFVGIPFVNAEQVYYCTAELATGFYKDKKTRKWGQANFQKERYTIKFNDDYTKLDGLGITTFNCHGFGNSLKPWVGKHIVCYHEYNNGDVFLFNKKQQRFLLMVGNVFGYVDNEKDSGTNSMQAGTCQKF